MTHVAAPLHFTDPSTGNEWYRPVSMDQLHLVVQAAKAAGKATAARIILQVIKRAKLRRFARGWNKWQHVLCMAV